MHITLITAEYPPQPGGIGDYTRCLATALVAREHRVSVLTTRGTTQEDDQIVGVERTISAWDWRSWREIAAFLQHQRPDVVHIQYQTGAYAMHPAINLLPRYLQQCGLRSHTTLVVTFHDLLEPYLFPKAGPVRAWVTQRLARAADAVVVTNAADAHSFIRKGGTAKHGRQPAIIPIGSNIAVAPPSGYERAAWRATLGVEAETTLVAYFGLLSRSKGVDVLLDALSQLMKRGERWKLLVIGGEATAPHDQVYAHAVAQQIAQHGLQAHVIRTGQVDAVTVSAHLLAADVVALPFRDGASFRRGSLLAALAHGCAVVTTQQAEGGRQKAEDRRQETEEALQIVDGEQALLVPPDDAMALAAALEHVAFDPALRSRLGQHARALAAHFSWDAIARLHENLYA